MWEKFRECLILLSEKTGDTFRFTIVSSLPTNFVGNYQRIVERNISCFDIYISVSKPSTCFWKRVLSTKWRNKSLIHNINLKVIERVNVVYGSWFSWRQSHRSVLALEVKAFCEIRLIELQPGSNPKFLVNHN